MADTSTECLQLRAVDREPTLGPMGRQILDIVAAAERRLSVCSSRRIARGIGLSIYDLYRYTRPLVTEGYLQTEGNSSKSELNRYVLTDFGWRVIGGKPIWME